MNDEKRSQKKAKETVEDFERQKNEEAEKEAKGEPGYRGLSRRAKERQSPKSS